MRDVFGIVFTYSEGNGLKELTEHRTVASVPFGGRYRIIDFMLSSMVNSGVEDIGLITKEKYHSLMDHIGSGRDWDLSRKLGGITFMPPYSQHGYRGRDGYQSKLRSIADFLQYLRRLRHRYIVMADSDIISNLPLDAIVDSHVASGCDITAVCVPPGSPDVVSDTHIVPGPGGIAKQVIIDEDEPAGLAAVGVYVMEKYILESIIKHCVSYNLYDFERDVLQGMSETLSLCVYEFEGRISKIQTMAGFFKSNMALLDPTVRKELFTKDSPIFTKVRDLAPSYFAPDSVVKNSLIADGCIVEGEVTNSVLFRGVKVGKGARIQNSIIMQDSQIFFGAELSFVMADKDVMVREGRQILGHESYPVALTKGSVV